MEFLERTFDELTPRQLYDVLRLRSEVFVVEQDCSYQDLDGRDQDARHLLGYRGADLLAYARWFDEDGTVTLGRIVTHPDARGDGLGRAVIGEALRRIEGRPVVMHAQAHLAPFYASFGFAVEGDPFLEDGIPHLFMARR